MGRRTKLCIFILRGRYTDEIFEIEFQRAFEIVIQCRYIHLEILQHPVNEIHFYPFHLRWLLTLQKQKLKVAHRLSGKCRRFQRAIQIRSGFLQ